MSQVLGETDATDPVVAGHLGCLNDGHREAGPRNPMAAVNPAQPPPTTIMSYGEKLIANLRRTAGVSRLV